MSMPPILLDIPRNAVLAVGLPLVLGSLSGYPTREIVKGTWYKNLRRPPVEPPRAAFGIVWPILYAAMGYASHLAVVSYDSSLSSSTRIDAYAGLKLYYAQLALNLLWTPLFFLFKKKGLAFIDIVGLTGLVYTVTLTLHGPTNGRSTLLLTPYCMWLTFATYLNGSIWWLNRSSTDSKEE